MKLLSLRVQKLYSLNRYTGRQTHRQADRLNRNYYLSAYADGKNIKICFHTGKFTSNAGKFLKYKIKGCRYDQDVCCNDLLAFVANFELGPSQ